MSFKKKSPEPAKSQAVRRVIKQGLHYLCGLCGRRHGNQAAAESCLAQCTNKFLAQDVTPAETDAKGKRYRCSFCKRIYENAAAAKDCARSCKKTIQKRMVAETQVRTTTVNEDKLKNLALYASQKSEKGGWEDSSPAPAGAEAKNLKMLQSMATKLQEAPQKAASRPSQSRSYRCDSCNASYPNPYEAQDCFRSHQKNAPESPAATRSLQEPAASTASTVSPAPAKPAKTPAPPPEALEKESSRGSNLADLRASRAHEASLETKFTRDGAKYVCRNRSCGKKYFTKDDVVNCFDSHGPEAEVYVTGSPSSSSPGSSSASANSAGAGSPASRNDKDIFYRDGAKYVCKKCSAKYFTRTEVVSCFDGHS